MKIARVTDSQNESHSVIATPEGKFSQLNTGDIFSSDLDQLQGTELEIIPEKILPPVDPRAIMCIGLNYRKHAIECNLPIPEYPVLFMKNPAAAIGHQEVINLPQVCEDEVDYECELAIVIGKECKNATPETAFDFILGYSIANDISARVWQIQKGGSQWIRGKSFDGFCPIGPWIVTKDEIADPDNLDIKTYLNDQLVQNSNTSDMIFSVSELICFLSQDTTLLPGTIILTGTPEGIGWSRTPKRMLKSGDTIRIEIEKIGSLSNSIR